MELLNETPFAAGWTMGFDRQGRELLIIAIKATFVIPSEKAEPVRAVEQIPLTAADTFTAEPGYSAPVYESDYAHHRPRCDVLLLGSAYAPPGTFVRRTEVGMRVGSMVKTFAVVGNRVWRSGVFGIRPSDPEPFDVMPISYDNAFGGTDRSRKNPDSIRTFLQNPIGRGFSYHKEDIDSLPMPNTEELNKPIVDPRGAYRAMAFGPLGRNWHPRAQYAGTYDQKWLENRSPFWPDDFDYQYFQSAPRDQQVPYLRGGEEVVLWNLTHARQEMFTIPSVRLPIWLFPQRGSLQKSEGVIDTLIIEPDLSRFSMIWRLTVPMRRSCFDMNRVIIGEKSAAWQRAQKYGNKPYYRGLGELVRARARRSPQR